MNDVSTAALVWWVALPYLAIGVFVVGHVWRWRYDRYGWTSYSTELQEHKWLKWGAPIFHYGTFAAIAGHVIGILIPESWTSALGISETAYHWFATIAGALAALFVIAGVAILAGRRLFVPRVRATTSPVDYFALTVLGIIILTGIVPTFVNLFGAHYDYRETVGVWFRGIFTVSPDPAAMVSAPLLYQIHATGAWVIWIIWPFTRLVHAWSYPLWYLWRPYVVYRSKKASPPVEPGTGRRKWRKIGSTF
jgi:nitrate reductase gamma subunit